MKKHIMLSLLAAGLITGCASNDVDNDGYNEPMIEESAGASTGPQVGTELSDLPAAVQKVVNERAPGAKIDDIDKETRSGRVVYEIQFAEPGKNPKLHVAEDGSIVTGE